MLTVVKDPALRAMVLSGPWGTGKTYLVREFAAAHAEDLKTAGIKFAYVSLFGIQSLADVRSRLAAAAILHGRDGPTANLLIKGVKFISSSVGIKGVDISGIGNLAQEIIEGAVLKQLFICVDDLERAGSGVLPKDVLGFISEMIEQKGCKCLLVLNKDKIEKSTLTLFEEKVFDLTIDFRPNAEDVASIGLPSADDRAHAVPVFDAFGSANIRVMRRLDWVLRRVKECQFSSLKNVWPTIVRQAAVLVVLKFERGYSRQLLGKVIERTRASRAIRDLYHKTDAKVPEDPLSDVTGQLDLLAYEDAGFGGLIVDLLEEGVLDITAMLSALEQCLAVQENAEQIERLRGLFTELRGGFASKAADFIPRLVSFLNEDLSLLDRTSLFDTCELLATLMPGKDADELVSKKLSEIVSEVPVENRERHFKIFGNLWKSGIFQAISYVPKTSAVTLSETFQGAVSGIHAKYITLTDFSDDELYDFLLNAKADNAMAQIRSVREQLSSVSSVPEPIRKELAEKFGRVLARIAAHDPLFKLQVDAFTTPRSPNAVQMGAAFNEIIP